MAEVVSFQIQPKKCRARPRFSETRVLSLDKAAREKEERDREARHITRVKNAFEDLLSDCEASLRPHTARFLLEELLGIARGKFGVGDCA